MSEVLDELSTVSIETIYPSKEISISSSDDNIEYAKQNIKTLINTGTGAIEELCNLAIQMEHPRAYEALATMIKNVSDMNKTLVDIEEGVYKRKSGKESKQVMNNKNVFIGTSKELLQQILNDE